LFYFVYIKNIVCPSVLTAKDNIGPRAYRPADVLFGPVFDIMSAIKLSCELDG